MEADLAIHPSAETLKAFGLGALDNASAETVVSHLGNCADCRNKVAGQSGDDFLDRLRLAHGLSNTPAPVKSLAEVGRGVEGTLAAPATPPPTPPIVDLPPELAGNAQYEVLRELGRGGMGVVYLARNRLMGRHEVLKVVNKQVLDRSGGQERFLREIQSAAMLSHPNVVTAYSVLPIGQLLVFAMEYIDGEDLARLVKSRGPLPVQHACYYVQQAALGLQHAFEKKMVHRDIKPQNLILCRDGKKQVVKVLDFGLAKVLREEKEERELTGTGQALGTPDYMAPEQILDAASADIRADIYSLGCTLYYLLTGEPPFKRKSMYEVFQAHQSMEAKLLNLMRPEVPQELAAVVRKMMAKEPAKRYQSPVEVVQALAPFVKAGAKGESARQSHSLSQGLETPQGKKVKEPIPNQPIPPRAAEARKQEKPKLLPPEGPVPFFGLRRQSRVARPVTKNRLLLGIAIGALALVVLAGLIVVHIATDKGELVIETDDPNIEVVVAQGGKQVTIIDVQTKQQIKLASGTYEVELAKGGEGLRLSTDKFTLTRGSREIVRVRREVASSKESGGTLVRPVENSVAPTKPVPVNRKAIVSKDGKWTIEGEELVQSAGPPLATAAAVGFGDPEWTDYDFSARVMRIAGGYYFVLAYRVTDMDNYYKFDIGRRGNTGINLDVKDKGLLTELLTFPFKVEPDRWYLATVKVRGNHVQTFLDGKLIFDYRDRDSIHPKGRVALAANSPFRFKEIEVKAPDGKVLWSGLPELDSPKTVALPPPNADAQGFVPLFNGKDLSGWHVVRGNADDWQVEQGQLRFTGTGREHRSFLVSDKEYTDYAVRFEFQADDKAAASFAVRSLPGRGADDVPGGTIAITADKRAGAFYWARGDYLYPNPKPQLQPPENWNRMEVRLHGRRLRVLVNGTQVQNLDLDQIPERPITQPYLKRSQGTIEFVKWAGTVRLRNLEWCDLSNTSPPTDPVSPVRVVTFPQGKQAVGYGDGEWLREGDELVQTGSNPGVCLIFGDVEWTDYDFSCDAMRVNGPNGFDIIFRAPDKYNWEAFAVGTWNNTRHAWTSLNENVGTPLKQSRNAGVNANEWHKVRVSVRGSRCQCFLDDMLLFNFTDQNHLRGAVGFRTWATKARFRNIQVTAPDGRVLWEGVPELNAANAGKD
jgi:serine/threonine protein kinase